MRRCLTWILTLAISAGGILVAHAAAYELTGSQLGGIHAYLAHAPQLVAVLATLALFGLAFTSRAASLGAWPFPILALTGFVAQEHVERLVHTGELGWVVTEPVFLVGLALQLPVSLAAWLLARRLLRAVTAAPARRRPPRLPRHTLPLPVRPGLVPAGRAQATAAARAPPATLRPC